MTDRKAHIVGTAIVLTGAVLSVAASGIALGLTGSYRSAFMVGAGGLAVVFVAASAVVGVCIVRNE